jgi:hypothetical protein
MAKCQTRRKRLQKYTRKRGGSLNIPTFHFLITSAGRPSLKQMLDSLRGEVKEGDAVTVIFDGEQAFTESGFTDAWINEFAGRLHKVVEKEKSGNWGHALRTKYQGNLQPRTTFVLHGDDDDVYVAGFLDKLRQKCVDPNTLYVAKMVFKFETVPGEVIPKGTEIKRKDIGTPNGIIPYDLVGKGEWLPNYNGDFMYYEQLAKHAKNIQFIPDIIYTVMSNRENKPKERHYVFYHIYCNEFTLPVLKDQVTKIIFSGLYDYIADIRCFLAGGEKYMGPIREFLNNSGVKFKIEKLGINDKSFERFTLSQIPRYITEDTKFLYIHSKGVSAKHAANDNIYWWRSWMEYHLIYRFKECIEALDEVNIVGVGYTTKMIGPHFSGNFWWSKGDYFKTLPKRDDGSVTGSLNIGTNYTDPENFIFKGKNPTHRDMDEGRAPHPDTDYYSFRPGIRAANRPPKAAKGGKRNAKTR